METSPAAEPAAPAASRPVRLHYLDWLRVLATLGVFLFHAGDVFGGMGYEIENAQSSPLIMVLLIFFYPWGMPLFFLVAGAGSWFALLRRSGGQFFRERTLRVLVPFATGTILFGPLQMVIAWLHKTSTGAWQGTLWEFARERLSYPFPKIMGGVGYHMWFLGFLFCFSLIGLPLFLWLKGERGRRLVSWLATLCERRAGLLIFILPLAVIRLGLHQVSPYLQGWSDFFFFWAFFVLGFLLFADERFLRALRRDWWILLLVGAGAIAIGTPIGLATDFELEAAPRTVWAVVLLVGMVVCGWCWTAFMLFVGRRFLDRDTPALRYGQETLLPFFVLHQPVILAIAYFVVQWQAGLTVKLLVVVLGSFAVTLGLAELVVKRVPFLRPLFGIKGGPRKKTEALVPEPRPAAPGTP